ncbi:hypothetical protein BOSEA31B_20611 [Hyphomicrobiales bacterium]|jgi:hypothetical protein|nr:hypothetical protein BOSEA31B_20611 [Hyphomicrobiales bacterium]CAH1702895.1 conserved hypothetical protein [Hyphomicrobiales bacterium]CAI0347082.1 hypothetical protein BO1005MUT1_530258 [Hyphomicrobiales bacterium]
MSTMISRRELEVLRIMAAAEAEGRFEEAEIVTAGRECWLDVELISKKTVLGLLRCMAVSVDTSGGATERYTINAAGRAIARRPELAGEIQEAVLLGRPFEIENDHVRFLPEAGIAP